MGYLNETGLATLVGKVKGQVVQLTSAEYQQIPAETKNYDNKLYLVEDEAYAYPVDSEPTLNSNNLVKSGGVYKYTSKIGTGSLTTTAQTLIPAVNELKAGVDALNNGLANSNGRVTSLENAFKFKTITPTPSVSAVSITFHSVRVYGKMIFFSIGFTTSAQITQYSSLISFAYKAESAWIAPVYTAGYDRTDYSVYGDKDNQTIRAGTVLPAGSYRVAGCLLVQ